MATKKQLTIDGLTACGWQEDTNATTRKYLVFVRSDVGRKMLIGKSGGLRMVTTARPAISQSLSLTGGRYHDALRVVGSRKDCYSSPEQARLDLQHVMDGLGVSR
jgi:hypothetical protein